MKVEYYKSERIQKEGASFNIIIGERSNGKSYDVKHERGIYPFFESRVDYFDTYKDKGHIIEKLMNSGRRFILLRRKEEEIKPDKMEGYLADVDWIKITNGEYNGVICFKRRLYLAKYDPDTNKTKKGDFIGYVRSLSTEQNEAGTQFPDVTDIIFEEFISRDIYLKNEVTKLLNFYSTVDRKKGTTKLWMLGNTVSKIVPYFEEWNLYDIINNMEQGSIKTLWIPTGEADDNGVPIEVKIAIEYTRKSGRSSFVFGRHSEMLNSGAWQIDPYPHLPYSTKEYKVLYKIGFHYKAFKFIGLLLNKNNDVVWFIYPYDNTKEFRKNMIVFSDQVRASKYYQKDIYNLTIDNENLRKVFDLFRVSNIFYATDEVGTNFNQAIDFTIRR